MENEVDAFIAHVGVKGMKWGRRKGGTLYEQKMNKSIERGNALLDRNKNSRNPKATAIGKEVVMTALSGGLASSAVTLLSRSKNTMDVGIGAVGLLVSGGVLAKSVKNIQDINAASK